MAGFFQQVLKGAADGLFGSPYLKDYKHANKIFTSNAYGNAPKFKWLFHVYFDINETAITEKLAAVFPSTANYGLLVKSIELPKYGFGLTELNQYNRKRYVQTKVSYDPIRVTFHDDNANQIRHLMWAYFNYHYLDPRNPNVGNSNDADEGATILNNRNIYKPNITNQESWGYLGEISNANLTTGLKQKTPFFKSVKIFGFNQHNFVMYQLINPVIESLGHDSYSYAETTGTMEANMTIKYETVKYYDGALNGQNPGASVPGFAQDGLYDKELSPISRPGNNRNILGQGGLVEAGAGVLESLQNQDYLGALQTAGRIAKNWKNPQQVLQSAKTELVTGAIAAAGTAVSSRQPFNFPAIGATNGNQSQQGSATNPMLSTPPFVNTPGNSQITGSVGP